MSTSTDSTKTGIVPVGNSCTINVSINGNGSVIATDPGVANVKSGVNYRYAGSKTGTYLGGGGTVGFSSGS